MRRIDLAVEVRADDVLCSRGQRQVHNITIFDMARIDNREIDILKKSYLLRVEVRIACDSVSPSMRPEAQAMIARRRQADEIEGMRANGEALLPQLVDDDGVRGLLKAIESKDIHQAIDHASHALGTIDMDIGGARVVLRPRARLQKRHQVRDVIEMKV